MGHSVTLVRGDGMVPEVTEAVLALIEVTGVEIEWHVVEAGIASVAAYGTQLPDHVLSSIRETKTGLKGPIAAAGAGNSPVDVELRKRLNLYALLTIAKSMPEVKSPFKAVDLVVIHENSEGLYSQIEFERTTREAVEVREFLSRMSGRQIREDSALGVKSISVLGTQQTIEFAFKHSVITGRKKITAVHDAKTMKSTDGLFLDIAREVAKDYPQIEFEDCPVDVLCEQLMQNPDRYDVLVLPNLHGSVVSAICAGMVGGASLTSRASIGRGVTVFEAAHDAAQDERQNQTSPLGLIFAAVLMLQHLKEVQAAANLQKATETVIQARMSAGLGFTETRDVTEAIAKALVSQHDSA